MLFDSHCHLDYLARDGDLDAAVGRAREAGVGAMITICTKLTEFDGVRALARRYDDVWCSAGVHPHEAEAEGQRTPEALIALARHEEVVGIGETGLDYYYEHSPRQRQQESFRAHIDAARQTGLPIIVHARDADADVAAILRDSFAEGTYTGVIHCFTGGRELADSALELGFYISISGVITFKKAESLRDVVRAVPLDRLLIETDAPYLAPTPMRGRRNEPAFVAHTAAALAALKDVSPEHMAEATAENAYRLFGKIRRRG